MTRKAKPVKDYEFEIGELQKYVNVSQNGHGIVAYHIHSYRVDRLPMTIEHRFGRDEGPAGGLKPPNLKTMHQCYKRKGNFAFFDDNVFRIKPSGFDAKNAFWRDISTNKTGLGFSLDVNKTFHADYYLRYNFMWSRMDMFVPKDRHTPCYTQVKIEHPTTTLYYQVAFGIKVQFDGNPVLIKIDAAGKETLSKKLHIKPDPHEDLGQLQMNEQDILCKYLWVIINKPELGATYRIVWRTIQPQGGE